MLRSAQADVAELVDAHASGACIRKDVEVRVLSSAPSGTRSFFIPILSRLLVQNAERVGPADYGRPRYDAQGDGLHRTHQMKIVTDAGEPLPIFPK